MASGMRNMRMALNYYIRKCLVSEKRPDGVVEKDSSSFFAAPLPYLCLDFVNLWVKFSVLRWGYGVLDTYTD